MRFLGQVGWHSRATADLAAVAEFCSTRSPHGLGYAVVPSDRQLLGVAGSVQPDDERPSENSGPRPCVWFAGPVAATMNVVCQATGTAYGHQLHEWAKQLDYLAHAVSIREAVQDVGGGELRTVLA